jgi:hypothetical protein
MFQADEMSFAEGDVLYVLDSSSNSGWWHARCGKNSGIIPFNYGITGSFLLILHALRCLFAVSEQTESIDYPLHEAAKRGNISFLQECLDNEVGQNTVVHLLLNK